MRFSLIFAVTAAGLSASVAAQDWPARCAEALSYSRDRNGTSVLVLSEGRVVCEGYTVGDSQTPHELWSGTKSFIGIMAAAAVQDGMLALDEQVSATLAEWQEDPAKSTITIRQLLSMTSGQAGIIGQPPGYADAVAGRLAGAPGERFRYGPVPLQTFGEVMRRKLVARGEPGDPLVYLDRRILEPLGISVANWRRGRDGNALMPQGASMTAQQWARFGEFIRAGGRLGDVALVDPAAFAALFQGSTANPAYGLTWWLPRATHADDAVTRASDLPSHAAEVPTDLVYAAGAGDQRLYVIPSRGLTIVRQARLDLRALAAGERSGWSDRSFLQLLLEGPAE